MSNSEVHYYRINNQKTKAIHIGTSNDPAAALAWAKSINAEMNDTIHAVSCCHCGLLDPGTVTEFGEIKEAYHTAEHLVTVVI